MFFKRYGAIRGGMYDTYAYIALFCFLCYNALMINSEKSTRRLGRNLAAITIALGSLTDIC